MTPTQRCNVRSSESKQHIKNALNDLDINTLSDADITLDKINRDWSIYQLKRGHRYSTDDMMTAWMADRVAGDVAVQADIGAGIGSCGLMTLWKRSSTSKLVMIEAQKVSHELAKRSILYNSLQHRIEARYGDLRDLSILPERGFFPLVTGTPPYFPVDKALTSPHPQRACCRMELRGNVYDYAKTAARIIHPDGWFVCCHCGTDPRLEDAMTTHGFHVWHRQDVLFRIDKEPTLSIVACRRTKGPREDWPPLVIRRLDGTETERYRSIRSEMGHEPVKTT